MIELQFLNTYNNLLTCNIRLDTARSEVHLAGVYRNLLITMFTVCITIFYLLTDEHGVSVSNVAEFSAVVRFTITFSTLIVVLLESYIRRERLLNLGKLMLSYVLYINRRLKVESKLDAGICVTKIQIIIILLLTWTLYIYYLSVAWSRITLFDALIMFTTSLLEHYILGNLIFVQLFAHFVRRQFHLLRLHLPSYPLDLLLDTADRLIEMKKALSDTFGMRLLLLLFQLLINVSFTIYELISFWQSQKMSEATIVATTYVFMKVFVSNALVLFGIAYSFDRIETEEQEFKNAVQSLQFEVSEKHSEDYLNFLDLINLKLMAESPKITACGLFTVNLRVFYNVFAAVVSYITILFQFRDFEKQ